ncbi:hypothetical protein BS78_02G191100 [Paspalum vaginatum]|nr:hypothetical protein BS78_02G191100 [Paspalum vaginatum]
MEARGKKREEKRQPHWLAREGRARPAARRAGAGATHGAGGGAWRSWLPIAQEVSCDDRHRAGHRRGGVKPAMVKAPCCHRARRCRARARSGQAGDTQASGREPVGEEEETSVWLQLAKELDG